MEVLTKLYHEIRKEGFQNWICDRKHKIVLFLIIVLITIIGVGIYLIYEFFMIIKNMDVRATLYIGLLLLYIYGCIYTLSNNISSKSRKFQNALKENENNVEVVIRNAEYISICSCIARMIKSLSGMIIIFMINLMFSVVGAEQTGLDYAYLYTYGLISYFMVSFSIAYIVMGFYSTDIMIVLNTDGWYEKKVKKLTMKYQK